MKIKIILKKQLSRLTLLSFVVMLVACAVSEEPNQQEPPAHKEPSDHKMPAQQENVLMLMFQESEPGIDPYTTRMLVSSEYLRMDDGKDSDDFTLFDRKKKIIYSITHENQRILLIPNRPAKVTWVREFILEEKISEDTQAPEIGGKKSHQVEFFVNGKSCMNVVVVPGLLGRALEAILEFRLVLAKEHIRNLNNTPIEMQDPCFLSYEARYPGKVLEAGFPIQEQDYTGRSRLLLDYNATFSVSAVLFQLPQEYQQFSSSAIE